MNGTTILFVLIVCIILVIYSLVNRVANARTDRRYGAGEHSIVIRYASIPTHDSGYARGH